VTRLLAAVPVPTDPPGTNTTRHHPVPNFGTDIAELAGRPGARVGWASFPDDAEVIYVYDRDDDNFGYAFNLTAPNCSEWGYAPFVDGA
jgi:hypothetical protein